MGLSQAEAAYTPPVCDKRMLQALEKLDQNDSNSPKANTRNVRTELCAGCGVCTRVCPTGAISLVAGTARIHHAKCTSCYRCIQACPRGAIVAVQTGLKPAGISIQELRNNLLDLQTELETTVRRLQRLEQRRTLYQK